MVVTSGWVATGHTRAGSASQAASGSSTMELSSDTLHDVVGPAAGCVLPAAPDEDGGDTFDEDEVGTRVIAWLS